MELSVTQHEARGPRALLMERPPQGCCVMNVTVTRSPSRLAQGPERVSHVHTLMRSLGLCVVKTVWRVYV